MKTSTFGAVFKTVVITSMVLTMLSGSLLAQFIDQSEMLGPPIINPGSPHGDGISFYDFNYDGWDDLTISNGPGDPRFYVNNNGELQQADFSIENNSSENISMMLWADYDNDGDADLLITQFEGSVQLWQNDGNFNFTDVATESGLLEGHYNHVGAAWADYNHDGCLDLYVAKFYHPDFFPGEEYAGALYQNNCDGTFTDVTISSEVSITARPCFQPVFLDFNNDGWEDLLLVIDRNFWPNELFKNNGDGTFTQITEQAGWDFNFDAMSGTVGDFDNDADLDVYLTNNPYYPFSTVLMQNNGDETFTNTAIEHGVSIFQVTWGAMWLDYDNDSWQDLFVSVTSPILNPIGNQFFVNNEGTGFTQQNALLGISGDTSETHVCAMGDLNNDGYYDFVLNNRFPDPAKLYFNEGGENDYLSVSLEGTISNRDGIGSWIYCYVGDNKYVRYTRSGENLIGQNSRKVIFGLGETDVIDSLVINWNTGTVETYYDIPTNTHHHYIEGMSQALPFLVQIDGNEWLCPEDSVVLDAGIYDSYLWNNGWEERFLVVTEPGTYDVSIVNEFGLTVQSLPITIETAPEPEIEWSVDNISCFGEDDGSIFLVVSTGPLDSITWDSGQQVPFIENLGPGTYRFSAIDNYGCLIEDSTLVSEPEQLNSTGEISDVLCYGENSGMASIVISGGTPPYFQDWNDLDNNALFQGNYSVQITDWNNCFDSLTFEVNQPDSLSLDLVLYDQFGASELGAAALSVEGGTPPYNIIWSTGASDTDSLPDLPAGEYAVSVEDAHNCTVESTFEIVLYTSSSTMDVARAPMVYPNPFDEQIRIKHCQGTGSLLELFNQQGQLVLRNESFDCREVLFVPELSPGIYMLRLLNNERIYTFRLSKTNQK